MSENKLTISASRVKMFQTCSWQYYCRYVLKIPDATNFGALCGTACHTVFECLLKPLHKPIYDAIISTPATIRNSPVAERYITAYLKKNEMPEDLFDKIDTMIVVGLMADYFCKGGDLQDGELRFSLSSEKPEFHAMGFIDKTAIYQDKFIRIVDYKSSKKKFVGDELNINVQAMMYSLAAKNLWPHLTPVVDFVFLQFKNDPIQRLKFTDAQLRGFKTLLGVIYQQMLNFTPEDAMSNLASKQKFPGKDDGFKGPLVCGWDGKGFVKSPDQLKKNGDKMYHCSFRFPFTYYALCAEDGKQVKTSFKDDLIPNKDKGEFVIKKKYAGCPGFKKQPALEL